MGLCKKGCLQQQPGRREASVKVVDASSASSENKAEV